MKLVNQFTAVDPMALLHSESLYAKLKLPRPSDFLDERRIHEIVAVMSPKLDFVQSGLAVCKLHRRE